MAKNFDLEKFAQAISLALNEEWGEMSNHSTTIRMGPAAFDAKLIRTQFCKKAASHPVTVEDKPITMKSVQYYGKCQPAQDLVMFINLFIKYGNNMYKALKEANGVGSIIISVKCALYGIETATTRTRRGLRHDQLSLSRIALAFPTHTGKVILKKKSPGILTFSTFFNQELPLLMQHTIFPGLIPVKQFTDDLKGIALVINVETSVILSGCKNYDLIRETFGEMIESSVKYVDAAINNDVDDEKKLEILKEAGILDVKHDGELELSANTVALVEKLEGIKALYPLKYSAAVRKARRNHGEDVDSDSDNFFLYD